MVQDAMIKVYKIIEMIKNKKKICFLLKISQMIESLVFSVFESFKVNPKITGSVGSVDD